jgi:hypothetical protein
MITQREFEKKYMGIIISIMIIIVISIILILANIINSVKIVREQWSGTITIINDDGIIKIENNEISSKNINMLEEYNNKHIVIDHGEFSFETINDN